MTHTSTGDAPKRGPGRPPKVKEERRKKHAKGVNMTGYKLRIPEDRLELRRYVYRWGNDDGRRIYDLTQNDDYAFVHQTDGEIKETSDMGSAVSEPVGKNKEGAPVRGYLLRKRRDWWEADQMQKKEEIEEQFNQMRRGYDPDGSQAAGTYALPGNSL